MSITPPFLSRTPPPLADFDDDENEIQIKKKSQSPIPSDDLIPNFDENHQNLESDDNLDSPADLPAKMDITVESMEFEKVVQDSCPAEFNSVEIKDQPVELSPAEPEQSCAEPEHLNVEPEQQTVEPERQTVEPERQTDEPEQQTVEPKQQNSEPADHTDVQDEDDFGAFEDFTQFVDDSQEPANSEWAANFEQSVVSEGVQERFNSVEESNWAADFEQPAEVSGQQPTISDWPAGFADVADVPAEENESFSLKKLNDEMDQLLCSAFHLSATPASLESRRENLYMILGEDENCDINCDSKSPADPTDHSKLWGSLHLIEESLALKYIFSESSLFRRYASSLKVDVNLAKLRRPNLPAFAWHLGSTALTPEKPADPMRPNNDSQTNSTIEHHSKDNPANTQFDWNTSGLSNPLTENTINYGLLDLDYFGGDSQATSSSASVGEDLNIKFDSLPANQLHSNVEPANQKSFNNNNNNTTNSHNKIISTQQQSVIKKYESNPNMNTNSVVSKREMSCESVNIVGRLPDLSFMLSPVLMFPVRDYGSENSN